MAPETGDGAEAVAEAMVEERRKYRYRLPDPVARKHLEYYRDSAHRGYLSHLVEEGHGPSLYFRTPGMSERAKKGRETGGKKVNKSENRLW